MRTLVIGCGYLGRRVAGLWRRRGDEVFALTRTSERADLLREEGLSPLLGDVLQAGAIPFPDEIETCLYAVARDRGSNVSQRELYVDGLSRVLAQPAFRPRRLIFISSTSVYGQERGELVDGATVPEPSQENGRVCLDAERLIVEFSERTAGVRAGVLRLSGIYGPGRLIARVAQLQAGEPVAGRPDGWLNLIHADDAARAVLACEARGESGRSYLVTDDRPVERREYYETLAKLVGAPVPTFAGKEGSLGKRCSNATARTALGWIPAFPTLVEGLPHALGASGENVTGP